MRLVLVLKMEMSQQVVILIILLGIGTQYYLSNKVDFQHFKRKVFKRCETLLLEWQTWLDRISSADFNENTEVTQIKTKDIGTYKYRLNRKRHLAVESMN